MKSIVKQRPINGFKKGISGNPHGRPKTAMCIPDILRRIGEEPVSPVMLARLRAKWGPDLHPKNNREAYLMVAMAQAQEGDADARKFVSERTEGKVSDKLIVDDITPREVIFKEVRIGDMSVKEPVAVVRTIIRNKP
jgi:hypothetical protein